MNLDSILANKKILFLIIGLFTLLVLLLVIRLFTFSPEVRPSPEIIVVPRSSDTAFPTSPFPSVAFATPSAVTRPLVYTPGELKRDYDRITSKAPLSNSDLAVRQKLLEPLNGQTGIVETTSQFQVEYLKSPNMFMVEIRGNNPLQSKQAAESYFKSEGLSAEGVCSLPVVFYLSQQVQNNLLSRGETFNPIPNGC